MIATESDAVNAARHEAGRLAALGYPVFPCRPNEKIPATAHGFKDATLDVASLDWPDGCNVGMAADGLVIIDVDTIDGEANPWPRVMTLDATGCPKQRSPRGGAHYIFRRPADCKWKCSAGKIAPGIDVRTDGGYIVVAPSTIDGKAYRWICDPPRREMLLEPHPWLAELLDRAAGPAEKVAEPGCSVQPSPAAGTIPEGKRNETCTSIAGRLRNAGLDAASIEAALMEHNRRHCSPPLPDAEVRTIAASVGRYPAPERPKLGIAPLRKLIEDHPAMRPPLIEGVLRIGEILNVIAAPKTGKSWLVVDLILAVVLGCGWLDRFGCRRGRVLLIDNELHGETIAKRIPKVAETLGYPMQDIADGLDVLSLRGKLRDLPTLLDALDAETEPGRYVLIVIDAWYRCLPPGTDECDNGAIAALYNRLDQTAQRLGCAFALIHHSSKGSQADKSVTDVGSGAGSMSRAADAHLILRAHEEDHAVVVDAVVRSWEPVEPFCLRWSYPIFRRADDLDPADLRRPKPRRKKADPSDGALVKEPRREWTIEDFVSVSVDEQPATIDEIVSRATRAGLSQAKARSLLRLAETEGRVHRWKGPATEPHRLATVPKPLFVDA